MPQTCHVSHRTLLFYACDTHKKVTCTVTILSRNLSTQKILIYMLSLFSFIATVFSCKLFIFILNTNYFEAFNELHSKLVSYISITFIKSQLEAFKKHILLEIN